jgi:hypothetical protein
MMNKDKLVCLPGMDAPGGQLRLVAGFGTCVGMKVHSSKAKNYLISNDLWATTGIPGTARES